MSLLIPGENGWNFRYAENTIEDRCFLCSEPISRQEVAIMWAGATGEIVLHARCATSFVLRLARDCWEVEHAS